jgi:predicted O-methyltransferase YrrM
MSKITEHFYQKIDGWFTFPDLYRHVVKLANQEAHFVEIGSWMGRSTSFMAVEIINSNKNIKFDCVDTWEGSPEHLENLQVKQNILFDTFLDNIKPVNHVVNPVRLTSTEASKLYADNSLDFVFIDANHSYEFVKDDINAWYPKVKKGGILAGHDYNRSWQGVIQAVDEFILKHNYSLEINSEQCWGITKR